MSTREQTPGMLTLERANCAFNEAVQNAIADYSLHRRNGDFSSPATDCSADIKALEDFCSVLSDIPGKYSCNGFPSVMRKVQEAKEHAPLYVYTFETFCNDFKRCLSDACNEWSPNSFWNKNLRGKVEKLDLDNPSVKKVLQSFYETLPSNVRVADSVRYAFSHLTRKARSIILSLHTQKAMKEIDSSASREEKTHREIFEETLRKPLMSFYKEDMGSRFRELQEELGEVFQRKTSVYTAQPKKGETDEAFLNRVLEEIKDYSGYNEINLGRCKNIPLELIARLPEQIQTVNLDKPQAYRREYFSRYDEIHLPVRLIHVLSFLPPHIKKAGFTLHYDLPPHIRKDGSTVHYDIVDCLRSRELMEKLPETLESVEANHDIRQSLYQRKDYQSPAIRGSYQTVFDSSMSQQSLDARARGIYNLLKHYSGDEQTNPNESWFDKQYRRWRIKNRQHTDEVQAVVERIDSGELTDYQAILYAVKSIDPERRNPNGGLQMRINFIQHHLAKLENSREYIPANDEGWTIV